jgi:hypothetical protein
MANSPLSAGRREEIVPGGRSDCIILTPLLALRRLPRFYHFVLTPQMRAPARLDALDVSGLRRR